MKSKLSIFLLITILLITGGYFVWTNFGPEIVDKYFTTPTPTPDPYAGWKTYTNEEYGFSIKYPDYINFSLTNTKSGSKVYLFNLSYTKEVLQFPTEPEDGLSFGAVVITDSNNQSLDEYVNNDIETKLAETVYSPGNHYTSISNKELITIDHLKGIMFEYKEYWQENITDNTYRTFKYFFPLNSQILYLGYSSYSYKLENVTEYLHILRKIVESINFEK